MRNAVLLLIFLALACQNSVDETVVAKFEENPTYKKLLTGTVISIADGDTFRLITEKNQNIKIRLVEIDAPERKQPFFGVSKQGLSNLIYGKNVKVCYKKKDRYGRILGWVYVDSICVNEEMVRQGLAWQFDRYSNNPKLAELEKQAREKRLGLWKDPNPVPPWEWRRLQKQKH